MYEPVQDGIAKSARRAVSYVECKPADDLSDLVHCFWQLKTEAPLEDDFHLHALPDACVNILFNQADPKIAGVTALRTRYELLNLGKSFHYAGIQFFPGVWHGSADEIFDSYVGEPYSGSLPLRDVGESMANLDLRDKQPIMDRLVRDLIADGVVQPNLIVGRILSKLDDINAVTDMALIAGLSPRQLQRHLKRTTGFAPHDLLKVLRLQQSFTKDYLISYVDQSHFIHSFRKITGYTPAAYARKFEE